MTNDLVRDRQAMLAGMQPTLKAGSYIFCMTKDPAVLATLGNRSLALFREDEGTALVLSRHDAAEHGFDLSMPMSRIVLEVFSALDGVGLTAGVATALAESGIPCNMVAAYHHDNVFVPEAMARQAIEILLALQQKAGALLLTD
ncbi:hypothetical protein ABIC16_000467 [Sphingomonas sp. PvP055]|uniref:ACT domain-containing protein n=1 Tax=Sphingomonas sp. PvP055 TaxID=3156391 RepID=UPI0033941371